jgi:hypothetical protein
MWAEAQTGKKEGTMSHASLLATLVESKRHYVDSALRDKPHANFRKNAMDAIGQKTTAHEYGPARGATYF